MARPSKLTDELQERLVMAIAAGSTVEGAAATVGINSATHRRWMALGEQARTGRHRVFYDAVTRAEATSEVVLVGRMATAARNGSWRAAAWLLERRWPERWARGSVETEASPATAELKDPFAELDNVSPLKPRDR
jgi:hypothetical protein